MARLEPGSRSGAMTVTLHSAMGASDECAEVRVELADANLIVEKVIAGLAARFTPESVVTIHSGAMSLSNNNNNNNNNNDPNNVNDESTGTSGQHWSSNDESTSSGTDANGTVPPRHDDAHPIVESSSTDQFRQSLASTSTGHPSQPPTMPSPADLADAYHRGFLAKFGTVGDAALASQAGCRALDRTKRAVGLPVDDSVDLSRIFSEANSLELKRTNDPLASVQAAARAADIAAASVGAAPCGHLALQVFERIMDGQKQQHVSPSMAFPKATTGALLVSENVPIVHSHFEGTLFTPQRLVTMFTKTFLETLKSQQSVRQAAMTAKHAMDDLRVRLETTSSVPLVAGGVTTVSLAKAFERAFIAELRRTNDASIASVIGCQVVDRMKAGRDIPLTAPLNLSRIFKRVYTNELSQTPGSHTAARVASNKAVDLAAGALGATKMTVLLNDAFEAAYARDFRTSHDITSASIAGGKAAARAAEFVPIVSLSALSPGAPAPAALLDAFSNALMESLDENGDSTEAAWTALEAVNLAKLKLSKPFPRESQQLPDFMSDYDSSTVPSRGGGTVISKRKSNSREGRETGEFGTSSRRDQRLSVSDSPGIKLRNPSHRRASCQARVYTAQPSSSPRSPASLSQTFQSAFMSVWRRSGDFDEAHAAGTAAVQELTSIPNLVDLSKVFTRAYISILEQSSGDHQLAATKAIHSLGIVAASLGVVTASGCLQSLYDETFELFADRTNADGAAVEAARAISRVVSSLPVTKNITKNVSAAVAAYREEVETILTSPKDISRALSMAEASAARAAESRPAPAVFSGRMTSSRSRTSKNNFSHQESKLVQLGSRDLSRERSRVSITRHSSQRRRHTSRQSKRHRDFSVERGRSWSKPHGGEGDLNRIAAVYVKTLGQELRKTDGDVERSSSVAVRAANLVIGSLGRPSGLPVDLSPVYRRHYKKNLRAHRNRQKAATFAASAVDKAATRLGAIPPSLAIGLAGRDAYERKMKATGNRERGLIAYAKAAAIVTSAVPIVAGGGYRKRSSSIPGVASSRPSRERRELASSGGMRTAIDEGGEMRVRVKEVPVVKEIIKHVPVKKIEYVEKRVQVPRPQPKPVTKIEYVDRIVEVPQYEDKIKFVPKKTIVERPIEKITYVKKSQPAKSPEVPKVISTAPTKVEKHTTTYTDQLMPTVVSQTICPVVSQGQQVEQIDCFDVEPVLVPVDLYVPKLIESKLRCATATEEHREVRVPAAHWNSLVVQSNPLTSDWELLPLVRGSTGGVKILQPPAPIVPPVRRVQPRVEMRSGEQAMALYAHPN